MAKDYALKQRPQKEANYQVLFSELPLLKTIFLMPSTTCGDVRWLIANGNINHDTHLHVVEQDYTNYVEMLIVLKSMGFEEGKNLTANWIELHNYIPPCKFDLIFVDLFGSILMKIANWMATKLCLGIDINTRLCITINTAARNNVYIDEFWNVIESHYSSVSHERDDMNQNDYDYRPELWLRMIFHPYAYKCYMLTYNDDKNNNVFAKMTSFRLDNFIKHSDALPRLSHSSIEKHLTIPIKNKLMKTYFGQKPRQLPKIKSSDIENFNEWWPLSKTETSLMIKLVCKKYSILKGWDTRRKNAQKSK